MKRPSEKNLILILFLSLQVIKSSYSLIYVQENMTTVILRVTALIVYMTLSFLTYRNNRVATIILAVIVTVSGLGALGVGYFMATDRLFFKIASIILGVLFTICGVRLLIIKDE